MTEWYSPRDIRFTREQCIWCIEHAEILLDGTWPPDPRGTGYTEASGKSSPSHHAPFETPEQVIGEIEARLKSTKEAGEALVDEVQSGITYYEDLSRPAKRALNYISGWPMRKQTYAEWKKYNGKFDQNGEFNSVLLTNRV